MAIYGKSNGSRWTLEILFIATTTLLHYRVVVMMIQLYLFPHLREYIGTVLGNTLVEDRENYNSFLDSDHDP